MSKETRKTILLKTDIQNSYRSHNQLCELADTLLSTSATNITVDLTNINFIASNLFSVLGCIFSEYTGKDKRRKILFKGTRHSIMDVMQRNGFCQHFGIKKIPDIYNTVIPYKNFGVNEIEEYERYLTLNLFTRRDLPQMTRAVSDAIRDSLLELFKNVKDHTTSQYIYTCGQYFPKSYLLYFTIVDIGETIPYNVSTFHFNQDLTIPENSLEWAISEGNTTLISNGPRGIGLSLIKNFVLMNNGSLFIVSERDTYEISNQKERYKKLGFAFPGTFVTVGFNLHDNASYFLDSENPNNVIQF